MTAPPSPPNRRRRRIVVIAVGLVSLVVAWWNWPRGDARFVGKWETRLLGGASDFTWTMEFKSHGTVISRDVEGREQSTEEWWVADGKLHIRIGWFGGFSSSVQDGLFVIWQGIRDRGQPVRSYTIFEDSADHIRLYWLPYATGDLDEATDAFELSRLPN